MINAESQSPKSQRDEMVRLIRVALHEGYEDVYAGKRHDTRYSTGLRLEASLGEPDPSAVLPVTMHNVSGTGMAFWVRREIDPGASLYIREFSDDTDSIWIGMQVTHCTSGIRGFLIGTQLHYPLSSDDLKPLEDELLGVGGRVSADAAEERAPKRGGLLSWLGLSGP